MQHVVLFHSVLGLREVEREFAAALEADGHRVSFPDLYGGARAESFEDGFRLRENIGDEAMIHAARQALSVAPADAVLAGLSLGAFFVGHFWAERPASPGALLLCGFAPWMTPRRSGMPVSAHLARPDPFDEEDDIAAWQVRSPSISTAMMASGTSSSTGRSPTTMPRRRRSAWAAHGDSWPPCRSEHSRRGSRSGRPLSRETRHAPDPLPGRGHAGRCGRDHLP